MQELTVHFVNRGYGTDEGTKTVALESLGICEYTGRPEAVVRSPFGLQDTTLRAQYVDNEWLCDLD